MVAMASPKAMDNQPTAKDNTSKCHSSNLTMPMVIQSSSNNHQTLSISSSHLNKTINNRTATHRDLVELISLLSSPATRKITA